MLPEFLVGTYRQYKADTKFVATWLASTARSLGYTSDAIPLESDLIESTAGKTKKKAKPKTKKQIRDAARRIPKEQRKYVISVDEFLPLALYIKTELKLPSRVPTSVLVAIRRVIEARNETSKWFMAQTTNSDGGAHAHFVDILKKVEDMLQPLTSGEELTHTEDGDDVTLINNMFDGLEVTDTTQEFLDSPGTPHKDYSKARMLCEFTETVIGHLSEFVEEQFAASALFRDIHKIYDHIEQAWRQYKEGEIELVAVAIISNTAIDLIRRLEEDFFEQFPQFYRVDEAVLRESYKNYNLKHRDAQQLINYMFRAKVGGGNEDLFNSACFDGRYYSYGLPFNPKAHKDARYTFIDMLFMFKMYFTSSERMSKCVYQPELGVWNPDNNYYTSNAHQKFAQDQYILCELFPDLTLLCTSLSGIPALAEDEVLRGTRGIFPHKENAKGRIPDPEIHLWWLVSLRMFCDIHHILGPKIGLPFETIRRLGANAKDTINECLKLRDLDELQIWEPSADEAITKNTIDRIHQSLFVDEVKEYIDNSAKNVPGWKGKAGFQLLRRHPVACGLMEFNIRSCVQDVGMIALQSTTSGITAAHLFNALQKEGMCQAKWADMQTFTELLGEDFIFGGARPDNLQDYCTRLLMTKGISLQTFAQNRRDRGILISKKRRFCKIPGDLFLLSVLKVRHCPNTCHREYTDDQCKSHLEHLEEALDTRYVLLSNGDEVEVQPRSLDVAERRSDKRLYTSSRYTPVELLLSLQFGLSQIIPTLHFDYLSFHKSCWNILSSLCDETSWINSRLLPADLQGHKRIKVYEVIAPVTFVLALGLPLAKAQMMVRKIKMPELPPGAVDQDFQNRFDQKKIMADIGALIENKAANGRLRNVANTRTRKLLAARPEKALFEQVASDQNDEKITFKGGKYLLHTNPLCTKAVCVCGTKAKPVMRNGWKKAFFDAVDKN